jgi:hypothetical protein
MGRVCVCVFIEIRVHACLYVGLKKSVFNSIFQLSHQKGPQSWSLSSNPYGNDSHIDDQMGIDSAEPHATRTGFYFCMDRYIIPLPTLPPVILLMFCQGPFFPSLIQKWMHAGWSWPCNLVQPTVKYRSVLVVAASKKWVFRLELLGALVSARIWFKTIARNSFGSNG